MASQGFEPVMARYFKLRALKNTADDAVACYAEIDLMTD